MRSLDHGDPALFLLAEMAEDIHERLAFLRHPGGEVLIEGYDAGEVSQGPWQVNAEFSYSTLVDLDDTLAFGAASFDLVVSVNSLDTVNDIPGALIQMRSLLKPGGLAIATFIGGASLPRLRAAMMAADGDRPAARIHPMVDSRAAPQLLQRAGWSDPVVDTHTVKVRYPSIDRLVQDLRDQALGNTLADPGPPLGKAALARARAAFLESADADGKVTETFEIVTLTGRRSLAGT
ncbi:MAG: methyltransferase domain-containing protein [Pseudomonadota bacterium]